MPNAKRTLILITGCNRGLGKELYSKFSLHFEVVGINRTRNEVADILIDLSSTTLNLHEIDIVIESYDRIVFISNASIIEPIDLIVNLAPVDIENSIFVNFVNPAKIVSAIVSSGKEFSIINITSGAAFTKNSALSLYSASKAAMHRFIDILSVESLGNKNCLGVINHDPGRMNTQMQIDLLRKKGIELSSISNILSPEEVADTIFKIVQEILK